MNPRISVIIPVYNAERYIDRCIKSVQTQSYVYWQMILIDDGSEDRSLEICKIYAKEDDRITVIHQENLGAGVARNNGLTKATGEYIVFIDSDDYIDRDYFKILAEHNEDIVFIDVEAHNEAGKVVRKEYLSAYKDMKKDDFLRSQMTGKINWGGVRKVVKRDIVEKNNIRYSEHKVGEEALFTYNSVYYSKDIAFIDKPVYFYIQHEDSLSHTKMDDPWGAVALALRKQTIDNGSYPLYANTVNAFILTAAAVSADRLFINYSKNEFNQKIESLYSSLKSNIDYTYSIDYQHMAIKAKIVGKLLLNHNFRTIRIICSIKHKIIPMLILK